MEEKELPGLSKAVASGLFWTTLSFGSWKLISMLTIIVLARILSPRDFGLVGIAAIVIGVVRMFQDMGVGCALVYKKESSVELTNTAFYMIIASGAIFTLAGYFTADYAAVYFNNPGAVPVLKALSANIMIASIGTVPAFLLTKELQFKKRIGPEIAAALAQAVFSLALALMGFGVWSLVIGDIVNRTVASAGAWFIHPWRPRLLFSFKLARELFSYSKFMVASSMSSFATSNIDNIAVARMLGATSLGYYSLAFRVASLPSTITFFIISKVTFPVFSKLQDDKKRLASAFLNTVKLIAFTSVPVGVVMFMLAPELVGVLLGRKWDNSIAPLQALVVYGIIASIIWQTIEVYKAIGRTDLSFRSESVRLLILMPLAVIGAIYGGIYGVAIAQTITVLIALVFYFRPLLRMLDIRARDVFMAVAPAIMPGGGTAIAIWFVTNMLRQHFIDGPNTTVLLVCSFVAAGLVFLLSFAVFNWNLVAITVKRALSESAVALLAATNGRDRDITRRER